MKATMKDLQRATNIHWYLERRQKLVASSHHRSSPPRQRRLHISRTACGIPVTCPLIRTTSLARVARARNVRAVRGWASNAGDLENGVDDTANSLSGDETSGNGIAVDVEVCGVLLRPEVRPNRADQHGRGVLRLGQGEGQTDAHHVGVVLAVLRPAAHVCVVADKDQRDTNNGEDYREDARGFRNRENWVRDGHGDGLPGCDRWSGERACIIIVGVDDARIGLGEEYEESRCQEDGDDGAKTLGDPLLVRGSPQEEANTKVADQVLMARLARSSSQMPTLNQLN